MKRGFFQRNKKDGDGDGDKKDEETKKEEAPPISFFKLVIIISKFIIKIKITEFVFCISSLNTHHAKINLCYLLEY